MYKVLDKELMLEECNIGDLTLDQIESFLRLWGEGSKIETLTLFLKNDGTVVLNKDNSDYELYKKWHISVLKEEEDLSKNYATKSQMDSVKR